MYRLCSIALVAWVTLLVAGDKPLPEFPVPTGKEKMLFYVQRSLNKNTIIYEINETADKKVNVKQPVKMYWVNYAGKGDEEKLNFLQQHYAYGLETELLDPHKPSFAINFVSYRKQLMYLTRPEPGAPFGVFGYFNGKLMKVGRIYVHIDGGTMMLPKVKYVQVSGTSPSTGELLTERIIPQ